MSPRCTFEEQLSQTAKSLVEQVYVDLGKEEKRTDKTAKFLVKQVYKDLVMEEEEERINKTAKSLVKQIQDELSFCNAIQKEQSQKPDIKRIIPAPKCREIVRVATLNKRRASKETRAALMYQLRISNMEREVKQLEESIEIREGELMEANCDLEELVVEKKALEKDKTEARENLKDAMSLVDMLKVRHDDCYKQAEATMSKLKELRRKTYKLTKWQRFKLLISRCFGGVVRDSETKVDEIINECDTVLFATSSTRTILGDC